MATLLVKAENLSVEDVLVLPFDKRATIKKIKPFGPKAVYVQFQTEYGWTRVARSHEVFVESKVL